MARTDRVCAPALILIVLAAGLSACQSGRQEGIPSRSVATPQNADTAIAALQERLLVVPAKDPTAKPVLVIAATPQDEGSRIDIFGPLLAGSGAELADDTARWIAGQPGCRPA